MKTLIKILFLLLAAGYLGFTLVRFTKRDDSAACKGLLITLNAPEEGVVPIDTTYVRELLQHHKFYPEGQRLNDIPLSRIDSTIAADPCIKTSLVYIDAEDRLCIEVTPHTPVMHIIPEGNAAYYISDEGATMPANVFFADLPLATGYISQQFAATRLTVLARIMSEDSFWDDQIGQIYISRDSLITIVPRVGGFNVKMGQARNIRKKLANLKAFYTDALPQVGWNVYEEIDLEYDNQIIATRKRIK